MASRRAPAAPAPVEVTQRGEVPAGAADHARSKVEHVVRLAHEPILAARVVLTMSPDPAVERSARAEASFDVNGTPVRAHAVADDMFAAVDLLEEKLERNLVQHGDRQRSRHRWIGEASTHEWRHGDLPTQRTATFPRPPEQREVVRRKSFALQELTPDEAAFDMDLLGHDFYLFTDLRSGKDAVVYRNGDGRFALQGDVVPYAEHETLVSASSAAPSLSEADAIARLNLSGEGFLFYLDPDSGRGRVLYLRYDGHYGLITAAES
ncbi:ribosomal subunit interface protein [Pedococcus cremeus]|uniref:Ribosomal subunit interface protein n=1 Tax=Pedococcus cremeus TaxID=587636 RepID=A0A1H9XRU1_9MICO|nr:ribosome-associated translation inhibitor RaiA [Pedococcus cremeus]SES48876.1 ribosomal subunit interface protein [Pedococcus cremeus]